MSKASKASKAQTTKTAAQQAELDRLRKAKNAATDVKVDGTTETPVVETQESGFDTGFDTIDETIDQAREWIKSMASMLPSKKRVIFTFVAVVSLSMGAGWLIGLAMSALMSALAAGFVLSLIIWVLGSLIAFYVGMKIGKVVGTYILSGQIDADITAAKNKVIGWFSKKPIVEAEVPAAA